MKIKAIKNLCQVKMCLPDGVQNLCKWGTQEKASYFMSIYYKK